MTLKQEYVGISITGQDITTITILAIIITQGIIVTTQDIIIILGIIQEIIIIEGMVVQEWAFILDSEINERIIPPLKMNFIINCFALKLNVLTKDKVNSTYHTQPCP